MMYSMKNYQLLAFLLFSSQILGQPFIGQREITNYEKEVQCRYAKLANTTGQTRKDVFCQ